MSARSSCLWALVGLLALSAARAETLYVTDQLAVTVSSTPDGNGDHVASIRSGERVEVLERQAEYALVRLESGEEGWMLADHLSSELPLQSRLAQRTRELERARQEVQRLQSELTAAQQAATSASEEAEALARQVQEQAARLQSQAEPEHEAATGTPSLFMGEADDSPHPAWQWVVGPAAVCLACGFLLGWRTLDRRIRRKYGGLRIY